MKKLKRIINWINWHLGGLRGDCMWEIEEV
jgi:hypothetical protein